MARRPLSIPRNLTVGIYSILTKAAVGDLRWKAPIQPTWNTSTYNATSVIPTCLQAPNGLAGRNGSVIGEDCLYLDVYTPAGVNATADLPVFVWIYGGSFTAGSAQTYDARVLLAAGGQTVSVLLQLYSVMTTECLPEAR